MATSDPVPRLPHSGGRSRPAALSVLAGCTAVAVVRALQTGTPPVTVPHWLAVPDRLAGTAPGLNRLLARRFGQVIRNAMRFVSY